MLERIPAVRFVSRRPSPMRSPRLRLRATLRPAVLTLALAAGLTEAHAAHAMGSGSGSGSAARRGAAGALRAPVAAAPRAVTRTPAPSHVLSTLEVLLGLAPTGGREAADRARPVSSTASTGAAPVGSTPAATPAGERPHRHHGMARQGVVLEAARPAATPTSAPPQSPAGLAVVDLAMGRERATTPLVDPDWHCESLAGELGSPLQTRGPGDLDPRRARAVLRRLCARRPARQEKPSAEGGEPPRDWTGLARRQPNKAVLDDHLLAPLANDFPDGASRMEMHWGVDPLGLGGLSTFVGGHQEEEDASFTAFGRSIGAQAGLQFAPSTSWAYRLKVAQQFVNDLDAPAAPANVSFELNVRF